MINLHKFYTMNNSTKLLVLVFSALALSCNTQKIQNPIFEGWYADPEVIRYDDTYWIYPTSSNGAMKATYFNAFSSKDLKTWECHECILDTATVSWAWKAMWAPSVLKKDGKYFFFFSANDIHQGEVGGIGVAWSDKPEGPYSDMLGEPLISDVVNGAQPIDQFVYKDGDEYYMYYGGWGHCNVVRLKDDFTGIRPFEDGTMYKEVTPELYVEGPFMFKKDGKYYFMWSEGSWTGVDYSVAYAISDSPFGPFERVGKILQQDPEVGTGAGHHSVLHKEETDEWFIVYHRHPLGDSEGTHRVVCIDKMEFAADGTIKPVVMTK